MFIHLITRRSVPRILLAGFASLALALGGGQGEGQALRPGTSAPPPTAAQPNPIQVENALPGDSSGVAPDSAVGGAIEGYASEVSTLPGDTLQLHVSTNPAAQYRIAVYRLGWCGGPGARLIGCIPSCGGSEGGQPQPVPSPNANGLTKPTGR